jgi:hypothetical protein
LLTTKSLAPFHQLRSIFAPLEPEADCDSSLLSDMEWDDGYAKSMYA